MPGLTTFLSAATTLGLLTTGDSFLPQSLRAGKNPQALRRRYAASSTIGSALRMSNTDGLSIGDDDRSRLALAAYLEKLLTEPANEPNVPARERETKLHMLPAKPDAEYVGRNWDLTVNEHRDNVPAEEMQDDFTIELSKPSAVKMTPFFSKNAKENMIPLFENDDVLSHDDVQGSVKQLKEMNRLSYIMAHSLSFTKHNVQYFSDVQAAIKNMERNAEKLLNDPSAFKKWTEWSKEHARVLHFILDDIKNPASFDSIKEFVKSPAQKLLDAFLSV